MYARIIEVIAYAVEG